MTLALRAVALLLCIAAGPWFVWSMFEAAELQAVIDAAQVAAR